ncbi:helicase [Seminavis robusta]|uniref:Helicase n=1 Tax=Seminavis robusta TaxID=568900 RepID=A0A9N8HFV9_9STRA|nr:helicase [Seminavis robusta]|eukprot:Sro368_g127940.1 helicase (492) ;mRNA; r:26184-28363
MLQPKPSSSSDEEDSYPVMAAASILASAAADSSSTKDPTTTEGEEKATTEGEEEKKPEIAEARAPDQDPQEPSTTVTHEQRWEAMFHRLVAYKAKHGHCLVPNRYAEDTQLGSWVSAQRRQYKIVTSGGNESAAMTPERAQKLNDIGFEWTTTNPRNVPWETRHAELKSFVANYGHAEVPMRWEENPQLSNWVSKQRHQYKLLQSNKPSRLNAHRVKLLNDVGFVWEASRRRLTGDDEDDGGDDDEEDDRKPPAGGGSRKKPRVRDRSDEGSNDGDSKKGGDSGFAAGRPGPLATNPSMLSPQQQAIANPAQPFAGQAMQTNLGLWAAMASSQASGFMQPGQMQLAMGGGAAFNPAFFLPNMMQIGASSAMQGAAGMSFPGQMAASMMPAGMGMAVVQQPNASFGMNTTPQQQGLTAGFQPSNLQQPQQQAMGGGGFQPNLHQQQQAMVPPNAQRDALAAGILQNVQLQEEMGHDEGQNHGADDKEGGASR